MRNCVTFDFCLFLVTAEYDSFREGKQKIPVLGWHRDFLSIYLERSAGLVDVVFNKVLARHVGRLLQSHDVEDGRSHVSKTSVLYGS